MPAENIKVAVRVRPFSTREKGRNAQLIISMTGATTQVINPKNPKEQPKKFTYDYSYWSHDGYKTNEEGCFIRADKKYIDQERVYNDLGSVMLSNAWEGYNCSIFAYGQTSSGKSYSIMGHGPNKGLVPRTCEELYKSIDSKKVPDVSYEVHFSMLEIYNEEVRDLLNKKNTPHGGLKVKENPQWGFYVEKLTVVPVGSYKDIQSRMNEGDRQRTIAATKMNEVSSRAHTIVSITFAQNSKKQKTTKKSTINLVDLAGSERTSQTEATGDRFEEAKNINKSLLTLGNVIKSLCDQVKNKSLHIPYRDAILTKLLKNALGGNSKTVMIAAISPDAENYDQTLSTLNYANRAKSIKTVAKVNQAETNKMIQELIAEKERLLKELDTAKLGKSGMNKEEIQRLKDEQNEEIRHYREQMEDMESAWQKRLDEARSELEEIQAKEKMQAEEEKKMPHLMNMNEDPALMGKIVHLCKLGSSTVGNGKEKTVPAIPMNGPRITKEHAVITNKKGEVTVKPVGGMVLHNGAEITKEVTLRHQDRLRFGSNNLFIFIHPIEAEAIKKKGRQLIDVTYDFAQKEIAKHSGINLDSENTILSEEVMSVMQMVQDVNAMAEDMDKTAEFALVLVSPEARGQNSGQTEVFVKLHDMENDHEYMWNKAKFLNRQVHMEELYKQLEETGEIPKVAKEKDPFWEPSDTEVIIGIATVPLKYLSYMLDFQEEPLTIINYTAKATGFLKVELIPSDSKGREDVDLSVDDPMDLVGKSIAFKIKIPQAMNLPDRFDKTWCRYKFYDDPHYVTSKVCPGKNPNYNHDQFLKFGMKDVDHKFIEFLSEEGLSIEVWGVQKNTGSATLKPKRQEEKQRLIDELQEQKSAAEALQEKLDRIKAIVNKMATSPEVKKIKKILEEK